MKGLTDEQIRALYTKSTTCTNCGLQRPPNKMRRDGLCASCYRATQLVNTSPPDYSTEPPHLAQIKQRARSAVKRAIKSGKLTRPNRCENCGHYYPPSYKLQAHHEDYNKPLDVVWLCIRCHKREHT